MFKKVFTLLVFFFCLTSFVSAVRLIDPLSKELTLSDSFAGTVSPGGRMELIFSKELTSKYDSLEVVSSTISDLNYSLLVEKESIKLFLDVPSTNPIKRESIKLNFIGSFGIEPLTIFLDVVVGRTGVSPKSNAEETVFVDNPAFYNFFFVNNTDAEAVFVIYTDLPSNWVSDDLSSPNNFVRVVVPKRSTLEKEISIFPRLEGVAEFKSTVFYEDSSKDFFFKVNALPTMKSKLSNIFYGVPFYSLSIIPSYFLGGLISFFI